MSEPVANSKLLTLLDASIVTKEPPAESFGDISDKLFTLAQQYALSTLADNETWSEAEEEQLAEAIAAEPRGLLLLKSLLKQVVTVDAMGVVPDSIIEKYRSEVLKSQAKQTVDFAVLLSKSSLRYAGKLPTRITTSFELARAPNEPTSLLQHTQRLNHCEVRVSIETGQQQSFTIVLEFSFLDLQFKDQALSVAVTNDATSTLLTQPLIDQTAEFGNLPAGKYTIQLMTNQTAIDEFRADLKSDKSPEDA